MNCLSMVITVHVSGQFQLYIDSFLASRGCPGASILYIGIDNNRLSILIDNLGIHTRGQARIYQTQLTYDIRVHVHAYIKRLKYMGK